MKKFIAAQRTATQAGKPPSGGDAGVWAAQPALADSLHAGYLALRQMTQAAQRRGRLYPSVLFVRDTLSVVLPDVTVGFLEKLLVPMELVLEQRLAKPLLY